MTDKFQSAVIRPLDVVLACVLLTRLPMPAVGQTAWLRQARATWAFGGVGALIGALSVGVAWLALAAGLPATLAAGLCLVVQIAVTGGLHEDGLADTADGFWGGFTPDRRLEIMADSRIGTYGVLALIVSVGLRWAALSTILATALWPVIAVAVLSRAVLPVLMAGMPPARPGGLSDRVGAPPGLSVLLGLGLGLAIAVFCAGALTGVLAAATMLGSAVMARVARAKIGGQTGDVLGATQQIVEILCLLVLAAML